MKTESQHRAIIMKGHMYLAIFTSFILQRCQLLHSVQNINGTITCGNLTCSVKSYCEDLGLNGSRCMCVPGYMGVGCFEDKDECSTSHENLCLYRGDCINTVGSFICKCLGGWNNTGHCETPIDVAENRKCIPGHMGDLCFDTCINDTMCGANQVCKTTHQGSREGMHCTCKPGWTSSNCTVDVNECTSNPCKNNGYCVNNQGSFSCNCTDLWTGVLCDEVNACAKSTCAENATCVNKNGSYECICTMGWNGSFCNTDVDECLSSPCYNYGKCINMPGSFDCNCTSGWEGSMCNQDLDECKDNSCDSNFVCRNTYGSFTCEPHSSEQAGGDTGVQKGRIIGRIMVVGSLTGIALIAVIVLIVKYRWMYRRVTDNDPLKSKDECIHEEPKNVSYCQDSL